MNGELPQMVRSSVVLLCQGFSLQNMSVVDLQPVEPLPRPPVSCGIRGHHRPVMSISAALFRLKVQRLRLTADEGRITDLRGRFIRHFAPL